MERLNFVIACITHLTIQICIIFVLMYPVYAVIWRFRVWEPNLYFIYHNYNTGLTKCIYILEKLFIHVPFSVYFSCDWYRLYNMITTMTAPSALVYNQTCIKRTPLEKRKKWPYKTSDLLKEVKFIWNIQVTA
jgi:hypothetical protein